MPQVLCKPPNLWGPDTQLRSFRWPRTTTRLEPRQAENVIPGELLLGGDLLLLLLLTFPLLLFIIQAQQGLALPSGGLISHQLL